jgi:hypothetical protein
VPHSRRFLPILALVVCALPRGAWAQQRPLVTEDPEPIGAGRILIEGGVTYARNEQYTVSGLKGNLWQAPVIGISVGLSSIAELQLDGAGYDRLRITDRVDAPLSSLLTVTGPTTHDFEDLVVATKIRMVSETAHRPSLGVRFATKLPNATNESGLGLDTTDFYMSLLGGKTVQSVRLVGNIGVGILGDPTNGNRQNDVLTYGVSFARALTGAVDVVGEMNGRVSTRSGPPFPGTETRGLIGLGARYTHGALRLDAGVSVGQTAIDPTVAFTTGFTYVFNAFTVP